MYRTAFSYLGTLTRLTSEITPHLLKWFDSSVFVEVFAGSGTVSYTYASKPDIQVRHVHLNDVSPYVFYNLQAIFDPGLTDFEAPRVISNLGLKSGYLSGHPEIGHWTDEARRAIDGIAVYANEFDNRGLRGGLSRTLVPASIRGSYWASTMTPPDRRFVNLLTPGDISNLVVVSLEDIRLRHKQLKCPGTVSRKNYWELLSEDIFSTSTNLSSFIFLIDLPWSSSGGERDEQTGVYRDIGSILEQSDDTSSTSWGEDQSLYERRLKDLVREIYERGGHTALLRSPGISPSLSSLIPSRVPHETVMIPMRNRRWKYRTGLRHEELVLI